MLMAPTESWYTMGPAETAGLRCAGLQIPKRVEARSAPTRFSFPPALVHSISCFVTLDRIGSDQRDYLTPDPIGFVSRGLKVPTLSVLSPNCRPAPAG
jgi:hypothetical protein